MSLPFSVRAQFPVLQQEVNGRPLVYLDSAASSQKPYSVIQAVDAYYSEIHANVHRGAHELSIRATEAYEGAREVVADHIGAAPAEVIFGDPDAPAPTGVIEAGCFRQIEFAGILSGSDAGPYAEALIDFMLGETFQEDIPLNMFVFPANENAALPAEFLEHTVVPVSPAVVDPADIRVLD